MRWFVTGAGGQLATAFEKTLEGEVFLTRETTLDIRDADALYAAVHGFAPDVLLHTAAYTDVDGGAYGLRVADVERLLTAEEDVALEDAGERRGQLASDPCDEPARHAASPAALSAA